MNERLRALRNAGCWLLLYTLTAVGGFMVGAFIKAGLT